MGSAVLITLAQTGSADLKGNTTECPLSAPLLQSAWVPHDGHSFRRQGRHAFLQFAHALPLLGYPGVSCSHPASGFLEDVMMSGSQHLPAPVCAACGVPFAALPCARQKAAMTALAPQGGDLVLPCPAAPVSVAHWPSALRPPCSFFQVAWRCSQQGAIVGGIKIWWDRCLLGTRVAGYRLDFDISASASGSSPLLWWLCSGSEASIDGDAPQCPLDRLLFLRHLQAS